MLHRKPPPAPLRLDLRDQGLSPGAEGEERARPLGVADRGGEADAPRVHAREAREPLDQAEGLPAAVAAQEGVHLVDHDKAQIVKQPWDRRVLVQQQRLERLGRDLQDAARALHEPVLVALRHIAVPVPDGDLRLLAQLRQPLELVVDKRLEGTYVDTAHRRGRVLGEEREDREEGGLGLAGGGGGGEQDVVVGAEDGLSGSVLHTPEGLPAGAVDEILDEGGIAGEDVHDTIKHFAKIKKLP